MPRLEGLLTAGLSLRSRFVGFSKTTKRDCKKNNIPAEKFMCKSFVFSMKLFIMYLSI